MADVCRRHFHMHFLQEKKIILVHTLLKHIQIGNMAVLVRVMAWAEQAKIIAWNYM